jgi:shikimate kinase
MGSGKSSVGRRLADLTGHRFVDTDELVVQAADASIPDIFSGIGEAGFRDIESAVLRELTGVCGIVLSTGGGIILRPANSALLKEAGVVAWVHASEATLFERASRSGRRPLLRTEDPRTRFHELLVSREALYEAVADVTIDSTGLSHDEVASKILEEVVRFVRSHPAR